MSAHPVSQTCCPSSSGEAWSRDVQTQPSPCCIKSETDTSWHPPRTSRQWREFSPALTHTITYSTRQIPWYSGINSTPARLWNALPNTVALAVSPVAWRLPASSEPGAPPDPKLNCPQPRAPPPTISHCYLSLSTFFSPSCTPLLLTH